MEKISLKNCERLYKNNGQHAEMVFKYTMTGKIVKADNTPYMVSGDYGDIQIKSARATICKGVDLDKHFQADAAKRYAYVIDDFSTAYIMNKAEYKQFVEEFGTVTRESSRNGSNEKIRLRYETDTMKKWLADRA